MYVPCVVKLNDGKYKAHILSEFYQGVRFGTASMGKWVEIELDNHPTLKKVNVRENQIVKRDDA